MTNKLFISGMFRSGTTLLTKVLDAHSQLVAVDDPFFQFFKAYRNQVCLNHKKNLDPNRPIDDHFNSPLEDELSWLENSNLDVDLSNSERENLVQKLLPFIQYYCPKLEKGLDTIEANTFGAFFEGLLKLSLQEIGTGKEECIGFKNTFCEAFAIPLHNTFKDLKSIFIMRDPRAVLASQNKDYGESYPILFALRHWRKSYACAKRTQQCYPHQCVILKYEDLITEPDKTIREMCEKLKLNFDPHMLDIGGFKRHDGQAWKQNSSYGTSNRFNVQFIERWKEELGETQIEMVDYLCGPEMIELDYQGEFERKLDQFPEFDIGIQDWIKPYEQRYELNEINMKLEQDRIKAMRHKEAFSAKELKRFLLYDDQAWFDLSFSKQG